MLSVWVEIPVADGFNNESERALRHRIVDELERRGFGEPTGSGSGQGVMDFSFDVPAEDAARKMLAEVLGQLGPGAGYTVRISPVEC